MVRWLLPSSTTTRRCQPAPPGTVPAGIGRRAVCLWAKATREAMAWISSPRTA
jgi:hypothetical protein